MSSTSDPAVDSPRVFISYAHESDEHKRQVLKLGWLLRSQLGIDARLDEWDAHQRRDWAQWAIEQFDNADFVLAIASPAFRDRTDGRAPGNQGWGPGILSVVLPGHSIDDIPDFLQSHSATRYIVERLTADGVIELRSLLNGQPGRTDQSWDAPPSTGSSAPVV